MWWLQVSMIAQTLAANDGHYSTMAAFGFKIIADTIHLTQPQTRRRLHAAALDLTDPAVTATMMNAAVNAVAAVLPSSYYNPVTPAMLTVRRAC